MKLVLGVNDLAYADNKGITTTGDVATYLENDYHVMRTFYELHQQEVDEAVANAMAGTVESVLMGAKMRPDTPLDHIESQFRDYIDRGEWEHTSGQKIAAAERGLSHRKKHPYAKRSKRTPFVDTGQYVASFRAWIEG